jgi:hypothetical protein
MVARAVRRHSRPMSWPSPTSTPPFAAPTPPSPSTPPDEGSSSPAAAWLAAVGGGLVLVAAIVAVATNWEAIPAGAKFAALLVVTVGLGAAAERLAATVPTTARAVAQLAAMLIAPVGVAAAAMMGATWPACVVVGGSAATVSTLIQARRWRAPLLDAASGVTVVLAASGVAALTGVTVGVLAGVAAVGWLAVNATGRAVGTALVAAASPVAAVLVPHGTGAGTSARIGLTGDPLVWGAPTAGVLAGLVLGVVSTRRHDAQLAAAAVGAPVAGIVSGLVSADVSAVVWWSLPFAVLVALEAATAAGRPGVLHEVTSTWARRVAVAVAACSVPAPAAVAIARALDSFGGSDRPTAAAAWPTVIGAVALAMATLRERGCGGRWTAVTAGGAGTFVMAACVAAGASTTVFAGAGVLVVVVLRLALRQHPGAVVLPGSWAVVALLLGGAESTADTTIHLVVSLTLGSLLVGTVLDEPTGRHETAGDGARSTALLAGTSLVSAAAVAAGFAEHRAAWFLAVVSACVVATAIVAPRRSVAQFSMSVVVGVVVGSSSIGLVPPVSTPVGWLALAVAGAATGTAIRRPWPLHVAALALVLAGTSGLVVAGAAAPVTAVVLMIAAVLLTGASAVRPGYEIADSAAIGAAAMAIVVASTGTHPALASAAWGLLGALGLLHGLLLGRAEVALGGGALLAVAIASLWFTSGAHDAVTGALEPFDVVARDVSLAGLSMLIWGAGAGLRRARRASSWVAYGPALVVAAAWLVEVQVTRSTPWASALGLAVGVIAVAAGGWRRLAAPLVAGTALVAATTIVSAGPQLGALPQWLWLALGGIGLLALAMLVERTRDGGGRDWRSMLRSWD